MNDWQLISTFDLSKTQYVLVTQEGKVRLQLWNKMLNKWQGRYTPWVDVDQEGCAEPTHWMPCPEAPPDQRQEAAYRLAMLGLQSERYQRDAEFREAVDAVLEVVRSKRNLCKK